MLFRSPADEAARHATDTDGRAQRWANVMVDLLATALACHAFVWASLAVHLPELLQGLGLGAGAAVTVAALMGPAQVLSRSAELFAQRWLSPLVLAIPVFGLLPLSLVSLALPWPPGVAAVVFVRFVPLAVEGGDHFLRRGRVRALLVTHGARPHSNPASLVPGFLFLPLIQQGLRQRKHPSTPVISTSPSVSRRPWFRRRSTPLHSAR